MTTRFDDDGPYGDGPHGDGPHGKGPYDEGPDDDGPHGKGPYDGGPDDPLAVLLRPPAEFLGAPPGRYEAVRRAAYRRRLLRTAVGAGVGCAVAALFALPVLLARAPESTTPAPPLAPPSFSSAPATPPPPPESATPTTAPTPSEPTLWPTPNPAIPSPATSSP